MTSDAHAGLVGVIAANLLEALLQRCRTHCAANLMNATLTVMWQASKAMLHSVYDQPDAPVVRAQFDRLLDHVDVLLPAMHGQLNGACDDIFAFAT